MSIINNAFQQSVNSQVSTNDAQVIPGTMDKDSLRLSEPSSHTTPVYKYPLDLGNLESGNGHYISFQVMEAKGIRFTDSQENEHLNAQSYEKRRDLVNKANDHAVILNEELKKGSAGGVLGSTLGLLKAQTKVAYESTSTELKKANDTFKNYLEANKGKATMRYPATEPKESVYLYIPGKIDTSYQASYEGTNLSFANDAKQVLGAISTSATLSDVSPEQSASVAEYARKLILNKTATALDSMGAIVGGTNVGPALEAIFRQVPNPHMEQLFKGVSFREYAFDFTFYPKNEDEARMIFNIIKTFKVNSMPGLSYGGRFLDYPNEFRIKVFSSDSNENKFIHKFLPCACTNVRVGYGEDSAFTTFEKIQDIGGSCPTKVTLGLNFTELSLLDKNKILEEGY